MVAGWSGPRVDEEVQPGSQVAVAADRGGPATRSRVSPSELEYQPEVLGKDFDGNTFVEKAEDVFAGIKKLMTALEEINGKTKLDKRAELRSQFYTDLQRKPGERPSEFLSRFRMLVAELKTEGVDLPSSELGWFVREKLGLDPLRKQLLETALAGKEKFEEVEAEALRLFKDLHVSDPLFRRLGHQEVRGRGRGLPFASSTSTGSPSYRPSLPSSPMASRASGSTSSPLKSGGRGYTAQPRRFFPARTRQAFATEGEGETEEYGVEPDEEELVADDGEANPNLDEVLEAEAQALAAELEEAEGEGLDSGTLGSVEDTFEHAAEALLSMREARSKLQEIRRDRGFGKASPTSPAGRSNPTSPSPGVRGHTQEGHVF